MAFRAPLEVHLLYPTLVQPFDRPGWVYEEKVDGWRMVAYKSGKKVQLVSRRRLDHTARFAALAKSLAALPSAEIILDGEGDGDVLSLDPTEIVQAQQEGF